MLWHPLIGFGAVLWKITLGTKHDEWGACLATCMWLSVVKTYTELVSISWSAPRRENETSQRKIRRAFLSPAPSGFSHYFLLQNCFTILDFTFTSRRERGRPWENFQFVRLCFVCTEVAVYDYDRLPAILGLKWQWARAISWKEQTVSFLAATENN